MFDGYISVDANGFVTHDYISIVVVVWGRFLRHLGSAIAVLSRVWPMAFSTTTRSDKLLLTHLPPEQNVRHFHRWHFEAHFLQWKY